MEESEGELEIGGEPTNVLLDTRDCCFLCHQQVYPAGILEEQKEEMETWRNLGGLCDYLKVSGAKMILESFKKFQLCEEKVESLQKNGCLFWANLCGKCGQMLEHLEEMIDRGMNADLVQLWRIKKGLQNLLGILEEAGNARSWNSEQVQETEESWRVNQKAVNLLREELKMKCAGQVEFLDNVMSPRVFLSRCDVKETGGTINPDPSSSVSDIDSDDMESSRASSNSDGRQLQKRTSGFAKESPGTIKIKKKKEVRCEVCQKVYQGQDILKKHKVNTHLEQFFLEWKPARWTLSEFILVCKKLLRDETQTTRVGLTAKFKCKHCDKTTNCESTCSINTHLLSCHFKILSDKLANWKGPKPKLETPKTPANVQNAAKCPYCDKVLTQKTKIQTHCVHVHPEQLYLKWKPPQQSEEDFKAVCLELWKELVVSCERLGDGSWKCLCCESTYRNRNYLRTHMVTQHEEFVIKKLRRKQERGFESEEDCDQDEETT